MLNRTLTVYRFPSTPLTLGIFILIMADLFEGELSPEDIKDLYNDFQNLRDFVSELTGILYDNTELPSAIRSEIETLYTKKFG